MQHLKWLAVPLAMLELVFLFFGLIWQGGVQLAVASWRGLAGSWPSTNT